MGKDTAPLQAQGAGPKARRKQKNKNKPNEANEPEATSEHDLNSHPIDIGDEVDQANEPNNDPAYLQAQLIKHMSRLRNIQRRLKDAGIAIPTSSNQPLPADATAAQEVERELRNMALSAGDAGLARAIEKMEATLKEMHEDIMEIRCKVDDNHTKTQQQVRRLSYKLNAPIDEVDAKAQEIAMGVRNLAPKYHKVALEMHSTELMEMPGSDLNTHGRRQGAHPDLDGQPGLRRAAGEPAAAAAATGER